jgi:hypothetical protein
LNQTTAAAEVCEGERFRRLGPGGLIAIAGYGLMLAAAQLFVIGPKFAYMGLEAELPSANHLVVICCCYALAASQLPRRLTRPSQLIYWMLFLLVVAPVHVTSVFVDLEVRRDPTPLVGAISLLFTGLSLIYRLRLPRLPLGRNAGQAFWFVTGSLLCFALLVIIIDFELKLELAKFSDVYAVRGEYRQSLRTATVLSRYVVIWVAVVLAPAYVILGIVQGNLVPIVVGFGAEVLVYSLTGFKSAILSGLLLVVLVALSWRDVGRMVGATLARAAALGGALIVTLDWLAGTVTITSLLIRRLALTAGVNTSYYYEYFADRPKYRFGDSVFFGAISHSYPMDAAHLIGLEYFNDAAMSANANLWADGFANLGFPGMVIVTVVLAAFMMTYDSVARGRDLRVATLLLAMPAISLSNSALFATFLTHGLLLALVILLFAPTAGPGDPALGPGHRKVAPG